MSVLSGSVQLAERVVIRRGSAVWLLLAIAAAPACRGGAASPEGGAPPGGGGRGAMAMPVEIVTLVEKPVEQVGEFVGTVKSLRSTTIQPQAEGFLTRIQVKSGDRVKPGTPLFDIDAASQQAAVSSLESVRAAREAEATWARQQAARAKTLLDAGAGSQQEYEQALALLKAAEAQLKAVDEQIRQQRTELAYHRVVAPTAGVVADIPVRVGDRVTRSTVLTMVEDNSGLEIYINVPVQEAPRLKVGLPVRLVNERGELLATVRTSFVSSSVDEQTQTVLVKAPLEGRGASFRTDQFVRAQIVLSTTPGITVPVVALNRINGQYFAFVAEPAAGDTLVTKQRQVTVGPIVGNEYLVVSGLKAGDRLIVSGIQKIGEGVPVTPGPPAGSTPPGDAGKGGR